VEKIELLKLAELQKTYQNINKTAKEERRKTTKSHVLVKIA